MQENLDKLAKGEAVKGTGDNGTVAWNPQSQKYFTTLILDGKPLLSGILI